MKIEPGAARLWGVNATAVLPPPLALYMYVLKSIRYLPWLTRAVDNREPTTYAARKTEFLAILDVLREGG